MNKIKVVVLMGGKGSEREVSLISGKEVVKNLNKDKYEVFEIDPVFDLEDFKSIKPDIIFIALHGKYGEDGQIQDLLDSLDMVYTGSKGDACRKGMNKADFYELMEENNVLVPKKIAFSEINENLIWPVVVKPVIGGSSIGVSIVREKEGLEKAISEAFKYDSEILIQEYIKGTELTCGVIGNEKPMALPLVEICPKHEFFDYESKYDAELCQEIVPARISDDLTKKIQDIAKEIYKLVGCKGFARIDFILKNDIPYVLEINMIPGLTSNSLLPKEAKEAGISYSQLLDKIIEWGFEGK